MGASSNSLNWRRLRLGALAFSTAIIGVAIGLLLPRPSCGNGVSLMHSALLRSNDISYRRSSAARLASRYPGLAGAVLIVIRARTIDSELHFDEVELAVAASILSEGWSSATVDEAVVLQYASVPFLSEQRSGRFSSSSLLRYVDQSTEPLRDLAKRRLEQTTGQQFGYSESDWIELIRQRN